MKCPKCSCERSSVIDSRSDGSSIRRRRECQECEFRFSTYERVEYALPMVVKKDGAREVFDRNKLRAGLLKACEKRPVSVESIDQVVESIERRVQEQCLKEIPSRQLGEILMDYLRELDKIAYVRFASVYREFSDISQFVDALESLTSEQADHAVVSRSEVEYAGNSDRKVALQPEGPQPERGLRPIEG